MINNSSIGKWDRLRQKQQDVQFVNRLQSGMNCSPFEAKAILNCVYEVYHPFFDNTASMKPGQILFEVVSVENSAKEKLCDCQMKTVVLTLDAGESDLLVREQCGVIGLRRCRLQRIAVEAFQQGGLLTVEDIANRLLNCGERTVTRDIKAWREQGVSLPLRSTIRDMGRTVSHREMIVKRWLFGMEFSEIARQTNHSIEAIANYVEKFKRVVCLAKDNHEISSIAFLVKISVSLAQQYYDLYQTLKIVPEREKELNELIKKTIIQT
jgi:transposase